MNANQRIKAIFNQSNPITERDIITLRSRANNGKLDISEINLGEGKEITKEQTAKGIAWLKNEMVTPKGKYRKNNPFGYREEQIIDNFSKFLLVDFYNAAFYGSSIHAALFPVYRVISQTGASFDYCYYNGKMEILG
jgi:hypothetical protein